MTFPSFPRAAAAASGLALLLLAAPGPVCGQSPAPSPSPVAKPKIGSLRLWNMQPIGSPTLELVTAGADPGGKVLQTAPPVNYYNGYVRLPPTTYTLKVYRAGNRDAPIKSFTLLLRDKSYFTILVSQPPNAPLAAELIDDTPDPTKPPNNRLTVHQFCATARVRVTAPNNVSTDLLEVGRTQTLEGLPKGMVPLSMTIAVPGAPVRPWNTEVDYRNSRHASVLVFADPYGRIRPRISNDGPSPDEEDAAAAEAAAAGGGSPAHTP